MQKEQSNSKIPDRELLQRIVERVTVHTNELEIIFRGNEDGGEAGEPTCLSIPFTPNLPRKKGITHAPADQGTIDFQVVYSGVAAQLILPQRRVTARDNCSRGRCMTIR